MLDSFKKWSKDDDLPPIVDEIGFLNIKILINGIKFIRVLKIFQYFFNLKEFGIEDPQAEIIDLSQSIEEFQNKMCKKYLNCDVDDVYGGTEQNIEKIENNQNLLSNSVIDYKKLNHFDPPEVELNFQIS